MFKAIILFSLFIIGIGVFLTQILIPLFVTKLEFFWLFKKKTKPIVSSSLEELESRVDQTVDAFTMVKNEVEETESKITKLKTKTKI